MHNDEEGLHDASTSDFELKHGHRLMSIVC